MLRTLHATPPLPRAATLRAGRRLRGGRGLPVVAALAALTLTSACAQLTRVRAAEDERPAAPAAPDAEPRPAGDGGASEAPAATVATVPATPLEAVRALPYTSGRIRLAALQSPGLRVVVSIEDRALWLMDGQRTVMAVPVAVGKEEDFVWDGRTYDFDTPTGIRRVQGKAETPLWVPPEWHYLELAAEKGLEPVHLEPGAKVTLSDSTRIEVRGKQVGRVNAYGNFWPFTPGSEIIFDGKIFIPPFGTEQRQVPAVLGTHKLNMGDGYLLHGTNEDGSIGDAVSHGCVRLHNDDVARLYARVPVGTPVFIY